MNEPTGKTASALAITEKKPHRPGGCVGIFFQLFDWNRRFAKKKLFSRKLLPPARTKASKRFGGDEKMPKSKLHLIADENSGRFPSVKKNGRHSNGEIEQKHEMRAPSLVARLMGLESMPAVNRDKSNKKASVSGSKISSSVRDEKKVNDQSGANGEDLALEKVSRKVEPRPQKIQKVESYDRRVVTRFGAEALQIKSVLSRTKKHQHPKFVPPVKSPRTSSARNASRASRLIDAAAKILEPGLQATNRAKFTLAYSSSMHYPAKNEVVTEGTRGVLPDVLKQSACNNVSTTKSLMGQTSCKNCSDLLDVVESRAKLEEQPFVCPSFAPNMVDASSQGSEKNWPRPTSTSFSQGKDAIFLRSHDQPSSFISQGENSIQSGSESNAYRKPVSGEAQAQWHFPSHAGKPQKDEKSPTALKPRNQTPNHILLDRDRIPARARSGNLQSRRAASAANAVSGAKDFVPRSRSLNSRTRIRVPTKEDASPIVIERKSFIHRDDSMSQLRSPVRKRTISANRQAESAGFINSAITKERNVKCNPVTRREMAHGARSLDQRCTKSRLSSQETGNRANNKNERDIISFAFNSPLKQNHGICTEEEHKRKDKNDVNCGSISLQRGEIFEENNGETSLQKNLPLTGDALSFILEQKLKELTAQEEDEFRTGCTLPKRSTAMILQELISALTSQQPISHNADMLNSEFMIQTDVKTEGTSVRYASHCDHFSPGSVLEASFSNDSCVSSSLDESLGHMLHLDSMNITYDEPQPTEPDADLLDSATSLDKETDTKEMMTDIVNQISALLRVISNAGLGLSGDKLKRVKEAILKAELLFGNVIPHDLDGTDDFLLGPFIYDEVESLSDAMWVDFTSLIGFDQTKDSNQLRAFLFDCAMECLDSKYSRFYNSGFRAWRSLPPSMNSRKLIRDVAGEIRRWTKLAGMIPDELIEWEMSYSLGKWTNFDIEAFETGVEMDWDILQSLVDEIVVDLVSP